MGLVELTEQEGITLDLRYATENNVTGKAFYTRAACFLHEAAHQHLMESCQVARNMGYTLKVFDGFRPLEAQQFLWDNSPNPEFVSNPETGSCPHCRGVAVDLTLVDAEGKELDMGTGFDDFTESSFHSAANISHAAKRNRAILRGIMLYSGWDFYENEWWHYQLFDARSYPLLTDEKAGTQLV